MYSRYLNVQTVQSSRLHTHNSVYIYIYINTLILFLTYQNQNLCRNVFVCGQMLAKHCAAGLGDGTRRLRLFGRTRVNKQRRRTEY